MYRLKPVLHYCSGLPHVPCPPLDGIIAQENSCPCAGQLWLKEGRHASGLCQGPKHWYGIGQHHLQLHANHHTCMSRADLLP